MNGTKAWNEAMDDVLDYIKKHQSYTKELSDLLKEHLPAPALLQAENLMKGIKHHRNLTMEHTRLCLETYDLSKFQDQLILLYMEELLNNHIDPQQSHEKLLEEFHDLYDQRAGLTLSYLPVREAREEAESKFYGIKLYQDRENAPEKEKNANKDLDK